MTALGNWETIPTMRFLLSKTDALGDVVVSLPVMERILSRQPEAEIHWLVRPYTAPLLRGLVGDARLHLRNTDADLDSLMADWGFDAVLNLGHRDPAVISAARRAGVPVRVARPRGSQLWEATHRLWRGRRGSGRHEAQNGLDFLAPWGWDGGVPVCPRLVLTPEEREEGLRALKGEIGRPLGVILKGSGAGAAPSSAWWEAAFPCLEAAGWRPVVLSPAEASSLEPTDLRGLMGRLAACEAVVGPSTGPLHLAAALGVPVLCLMGLRVHHGPDRWTPLGSAVQVLQYPGPEADLAGGMDRLDPQALLPHLNRLT